MTGRPPHEEAIARIRRDRLVEILRELVDVPSPTGEERALAETIVSMLRAAGIDSSLQALDERQANAVGRIAGTGDGQSVLLYAPIDTVTAGNAAEDLPWAADEMRADMLAHSRLVDGHVVGLGAHNPKGHVACIIAAAEAIKATCIPFRGDLLLGFGAGGMPTEARTGMRPESGHGTGCAFMLQQQPRPDFAIIAKSGWTVSWEEVGFCWFEVRVKGTHTYVGSRHLLPYVNAIHQAARLIDRLERWFPVWAEGHRDGLVMPQGVVSQIEAGWKRMPAFTPAQCRFRVDLRIGPRSTVAQACEEFGVQVEQFARELGIDLEWECVRAIAGSSTPKENWIVQRTIDSWEEIERRPHEAFRALSGATDANILRAAGIPTARIGLPKATLPSLDFQLGMNAVNIDDMEKLTRLLIHSALETVSLNHGASHG